MALRIKKQYKNPDGTVTEIEGTQEEINEYEKKNSEPAWQKKEGADKKKKKEVLLG